MKMLRVLPLSLMCLLTPWLLCLLAAPLHAQVADVPLPILVARAQRVVIAHVESAGPVQQKTVKAPEGEVPTGWWRSYTVVVKEDLQNPDKAKGPAVEKLNILAQAPVPPEPGGMQMVMLDGPAYPTLEVNKDYLLILEKLPANPELYLPAYFKNFRPADDPEVKQVRPIADPATWPWGKEVKGLQLLFWPEARYTHDGPNGARMCFLQAVAGLRNVSAQTIQVNLFDGDRTLNAVATNDVTGAKVPTTWYDNRDATRKFNAASDNLDIKPGEILWIGPSGKAPWGLGLDLPLTDGNWTITATYTNARVKEPVLVAFATDPFKLRPLWAGTLEAGSVKMTVPAPKIAD